MGAWLGPPLEIKGMQNSGNDGVRSLQAMAATGVVPFARSLDFEVREIPGLLEVINCDVGIRMEGCGGGTVDDRTRQLCISVSSG